MPAPTTTIWNLDPHTAAKHAILRRYLAAWVPILSQGGFPEFLYIDGFAGPGRYSKGEDGSPIIALKAALEQTVTIRSHIEFMFVEKEPKRAEFLQRLLQEMVLPPNFDAYVVPGVEFEAAFRELFDRRKHRLPPTFAFIDPFGWRGIPFDIVTQIMRFTGCEVFVTFMYEEINRFIGASPQESNFTRFFGDNGWTAGINIPDPKTRNRFLHDFYKQQLHHMAKAEYVRSFQMKNDRDVTDYYLFYATNNKRGLAKMKEAMWAVDKSGDFTFSDATDPNQLVLFAKEPQFSILSEQIISHFQGRETTVAEVEEFVLAETAFRETHYKRRILKPLESQQPPRLTVVEPPPGRKKGTYANPNMKLRFV